MEPRRSCEREHDFALVLSGVTDLGPEVMDALYEAGCDDATPSLRSGVVFLTFSRTAPTAKDAYLSAIRNVREANIGASVARIDSCNFVTQREIGQKVRMSRQLVHQYITGARGPGGFPPPACYITEDVPVWEWCEVAYWLRSNDMIKEEEYADASLLEIINTVLDLAEQQEREPSLADEVVAALLPRNRQISR